jgi:large subunit ribosomal protein L6
MSRIAKKPIVLPAGVKIAIKEGLVHTEGPKGKIFCKLLDPIQVTAKGSEITVGRVGNSLSEKALHGTMYRLITNMIEGVSKGFQKTLLIEGVGFKAEVKGAVLVLNLGFTHLVEIPVPQGLAVKTVKPTELLIEGVSKEMVGLFAARVRSIYEPEPYKGKGVRYVDEVIRRKAGKAVSK